MLLDEPFANLDRRLREQMRSELRRLHLESRTTFVMVTHDQEEAMAVSDLLGVMSAGKLLQFGKPVELYRNPRMPFVARFLGEGNLLPSEMLGLKGERLVLVRPEDISVGDSASKCPHSWDGIIEEITFHGPDRTVSIRCGSTLLTVRTHQSRELAAGQTLRVGIPPESIWVIPDSDEA